jgi:hypothetical protein
MPRAKKPSATLTLSEFNKLESAVMHLFGQVRAALTDSEEHRQLVERLAQAGFLPASKATTKAVSAPSPKSAANGVGTARRRRRRQHSPIDPSKIVAAVKKAGAAGRTTGQIAVELGVDAEPLRHRLYELRDGGTLTMIGKMGGAKYVLASAKGSPSDKSVKRAKPAKRGKAKKQAKPASKEPEAPSAAATS